MTRLILKLITPMLLVALTATFAHSSTPPAPDARTPDGGNYFGPLVEGKLHGKGKIEWPSGDRYEGEFKDGRFSGVGKLEAKTYTYEGEFKDGMMAGRGRYVVPGREVYVGQFADNFFNGHGKYEYDGNVYEGSFVNGTFEGLGTFKTADHEYKGQLKKGKYEGQGEINYADGRKYVGTFANGIFQGKGRYETPTKVAYEGDFDKGEFEGQGTARRGDGSHYTGGFKNWRFHGAGKYTDAKGDAYEGNFENGQLIGKGVWIGKSGSRYEGEFDNWKFHGQGVYRDAKGEYKGGFSYGLYDGEGTYTYAKPQDDGRTKDVGTWRYGVKEDKAAEQLAKANVETALYNQRALLDKKLAALLPQNPQKIDMYMLAIGGDGSQEVFRREVEFVQKQFDRDFGTQGRSLALINSRTTVVDAPMATVTSIRESLAAIAKKMDKENDILFLFLTSHGSKDHNFTLSQTGIDLPDLQARELGKLLKESGIRWKVAVISACYSGGFIDTIKDEYTMVMTASRHDRSSFGCEDENDFTYFGRAFFNDSLPKAASFQEAFKNAQALIKQWEAEDFKKSDKDKSDKNEHSEPQIHHSSLLERKLKQWRDQLGVPQERAAKQ